MGVQAQFTFTAMDAEREATAIQLLEEVQSQLRVQSVGVQVDVVVATDYHGTGTLAEVAARVDPSRVPLSVPLERFAGMNADTAGKPAPEPTP